MIDGRFDQHFAELMAASIENEGKTATPAMLRAIAFVCLLGVAGFIGILIVIV